MTATLVWDGGCTLGEGPVWDAAASVLWFVDIKKRHVHRYDPSTDTVDAWPAPAQVGWVLPSTEGRLLAGLQSGLAIFDPESGKFEALTVVEPSYPTNRLNDATVAPDGTVWFGSMDDGESEITGRFYKWDGRSVVDAGIDPVCITNGPGVSPDGRLLYHVDTLGGVIHVADLDADGSVGTSRVFARIDPADGHPDGVIVDSAGNVWLGLWGGWRARLYNPQGEIIREVRLPVANVTKIALGGDDLCTAYATTASAGLDAAALPGQPLAGGLFTFRVDVPGQRGLPARID